MESHFMLSLVFLTVLHVLCGVSALQKGTLLLHQTPLADHSHEIQLTNGQYFVKALVSKTEGLLSCQLSEDKGLIDSFLKNWQHIVLDIGTEGIVDVWKRCITKEMASLESKTKRNGVDGTGVPFSPEKTGDPAGHKFDPAIFPGTKWCGLDNVATSYDDLGKFKATDMCCRDHDHCPYFLDHFEEKYHLRNPYPWTISHCDCDNELFNCLKKTNTTTSNEVGKMFFGLLNVKCIKFETGEYCAKEHWSKLWCEQKTTGERAVIHEFPSKWEDDVVG